MEKIYKMKLIIFVRGLSPFPSAWSSVNNKIIKIYKSREYSNTIEKKLEPGTIMMNKNTLLVFNRKWTIRGLRIKLEGKK